MAADPSILAQAVEDYIASMSKQELKELLATARDPEEAATPTPVETTDQIGRRMFRGEQ